MEELSEKFKAGKINAKQLKEAVRELAKGYGKDIGIDFEVVYLDEKTMPKDSKGSIGSSYILDKENKRVLIPIDIEKIKKTGDLFGTITEEISHGKDALEGRQDKKVAEDNSNKEKGLETLGRPANEYVKKKFGEDNNSKIKLTTDGIDLSNADVGEKVGDVVNESYETATFSSAFSSAGIGLIGIGGLSLSLEDNKEELNKISNFIRFPYITVKFLVNKKLTEKDKDVMHTLSPIPENMKRPIVFPFPIPSPEERIFRLPPMVPPKQETPKERWEREERIRREEQEFFNELQKPNGIPLHQERPVTIYKIQYEKGDFVEVPLDENGKVKDGFIEVVSRDGKGKGYVNKKDNGYWEKDRRAGSIFAHGGSYWKRYPSRRDAEKSEKNRITITSGIETENDKDTLKKGKGKVLR